MNSFFAILTFSVTVASLLSGTEAQFGSLTPCDDLVKSLAVKKIRIFEGPGAEKTIGIKNELCYVPDEIALTFRVLLRRLFYCPVGFIAFVPGFDTADSMDSMNSTNVDYSQVIDLTEYTNGTNLIKEVIFCVAIPTEPPTPKPTPPTLASCPSGPTRTNQYLRRDQTKICAFRCSFGVAYAGASIGTRSRTVWQCCDGKPARLVSRASRLYTCT